VIYNGNKEIDYCNLFSIEILLYEIDTRQNINILMYQVNLAKYGNGVYHMAVRTS
jgi:hypothetical protein